MHLRASSYALPNIEKLSITQDVTRHCNRFRRTSRGPLATTAWCCGAPSGKIGHLGRGRKCLFRSANAKRLRAAGFEVLEAANSAEAELILKSTTVDALFVPV